MEASGRVRGGGGEEGDGRNLREKGGWRRCWSFIGCRCLRWGVLPHNGGRY